MKLIKTITCAGVIAASGVSVLADTIFDNGPLYNGNAFAVTDGQTVGNEITLGAGISLTNFEFEYFSPSLLSANLSLGVDVRFYLNDGPHPAGYPIPQTLFYDSGWYYNTTGVEIPTGSNDLSYAYSDLYSSGLTGAHNLAIGSLLPSDFTYTITFTNLGSDVIDIPLANNSAGTNFGTYWLYDNVSSQWSLLTNSAPANFVSQFAGTPEPSVVGLGAIGGLLLVGVNKLRRKS
jgi:hypothetical protein